MRNLIRKIGVMLLSAATAVTVSIIGTADLYADIIWEPENSFYNSHDCPEEDRTYTANSIDDEGLKIYESPESSKVIEVVPNGSNVWISHTYTDAAGNVWGCAGAYEGWVPMDYLALNYDSRSFFEDYSDQITDESGTFDTSAYGENDRLFIYNYPGAEDNYDLEIYDDDPGYYGTFTDPEGHTWGYVSYYYIQSGWICLDAPTASFSELYPNGQNFSGLNSEIAKPSVVVEPIKKVNIPLIAGICVGVIVIVTAVILIIIFSRKSAKKDKGVIG